jgi:CheY-like chemotaxis protein
MTKSKNLKTILVVEDEAPLRTVICDKLKSNNFSVLAAKSMAEAFKHIQETKTIDAIWLDHYLLGKKNGLDFVNELKTSIQWRKIPIFVVSNTAGMDKIEVYMKLGINNYYTKSNHKLNDIIKDIKKTLKM